MLLVWNQYLDSLNLQLELLRSQLSSKNLVLDRVISFKTQLLEESLTWQPSMLESENVGAPTLSFLENTER